MCACAPQQPRLSGQSLHVVAIDATKQPSRLQGGAHNYTAQSGAASARLTVPSILRRTRRSSGCQELDGRQRDILPKRLSMNRSESAHPCDGEPGLFERNLLSLPDGQARPVSLKR